MPLSAIRMRAFQQASAGSSSGNPRSLRATRTSVFILPRGPNSAASTFISMRWSRVRPWKRHMNGCAGTSDLFTTRAKSNSSSRTIVGFCATRCRGVCLRRGRPRSLSSRRGVRAGRIVTNQDWKPHEVRFAHSSPPRPRDHEQFFKAPVCFGAGENALVLPRPVLELSCAAADPALLGMLDRYATERLRRTPASATFVDRVRAELSEELHDGDPSAEGLARRLKMSVRTLNRKLAAEETSYRQLLDRLRHRLAVRLLNDRRVSVSEVAFLAGFSELSAFNRAFKRWTGLTPSAFRQQRKT